MPKSEQDLLRIIVDGDLVGVEGLPKHPGPFEITVRCAVITKRCQYVVCRQKFTVKLSRWALVTRSVVLPWFFRPTI